MSNFKLQHYYIRVIFTILFIIHIDITGFFVSNAQAAQSISVRVAGSFNDAEELDSGVVQHTSSDLELIKEGSDQTVGMRFQNIAIPSGATIVSASIVFTADETNARTTQLDFYAEATDNAVPFSTATNNISSRTVTTAVVNWQNIPAWDTVGAEHQSPDLSPIIQEIIDRPGWAYNNTLAIIISGSGKRTAQSYDGSPTQAPLLQLEFISGPDIALPSTPTGLTATTLSSSRIKLLWNAATDNNKVSGYTIYNCSGVGCVPGTIIGTTTSTIYSDKELTANTSYTYRVEAFDPSDNTSPASAPASATTLPAGQAAFHTLVGAGDIAKSGSLSSPNEATAQLIDTIVADDPETIVFTTGDNAYKNGTVEDYATKYAPTWGRHRSRTYPSPGNHDYKTNNATPYFDYFCPNSSDCVFPDGTQQAYYSYDLGDWHIISLDSNVDYRVGSAQIQWLQQDLADHPNSCIMAYLHRPYYSSGRHGSTSNPLDLWRELYAAGADIIVSGHEHSYERFAKQDLNSNLDPSGIRSFVVGTGGAGLYAFNDPIPNSEVRYNDSHGIISFTLLSDSYSWEFIPIEGFTFSDSGSDTCNNRISSDAMPSISISNPKNGTEIVGAVSITANAMDDNSITLVEFFIDSTLISTTNTAPYTATWDSTSMADGDYTVLVTVHDDAGQSSSDSINVTINNVDEPPLATNDSESTFEGTPITIDVAANDNDPNDNLDPTTTNTACLSCTLPTNGELTNNGNGSFNYAPNPDFTGADNFVYEICDTLNACDSATVEVTVNPSESMILEVRVGASSDDAEESPAGRMFLLSSDLELIHDANDQTIGMRFNNITIPQTATIHNAYIQFQVDELSPIEPASLTIHGEGMDNAATFTYSTKNISSRTRTTAAVSWSPVMWTTIGEAELDQQTPDIAMVIQEIINRPGWSNGNSLAVIITGTGKRTAESYNGDQAGAPLLHIEYHLGPPNDPPIANDDSISTPANTRVRINVATNDNDPDDNLDLTTANTACANCSVPTNGTLTNKSNGNFDYFPNPNFTGTDNFVYQICDTDGLCETATASITVLPQETHNTLEIRVSSNTDDAEENSSSGIINLSSSDLELVDEGRSIPRNQIVGIRFKGITIPQGATISNAFIQFQSDETNSKAISLTIEGEALENAPTFTSTNNNISSRTRTEAAVDWLPVAWSTIENAGPDQQTPDISVIIQEIVNQPGWSNSNSLVIIITGIGKRTANSFDGDPTTAPLLHIEYQ